MNAVIDKPKAKAEPKFKAAPLVYIRPHQEYVSDTSAPLMHRLGTLHGVFSKVDDQLEAIYDAVAIGDPIETILDHVAHELIGDATRPMRGMAPTKADAEATYFGLFEPVPLMWTPRSTISVLRRLRV
jgi:hypothetical protein